MKRSRKRKPKLPPTVEGYVLALYECVRDDAPLVPIERRFMPRTLADARTMVLAYNRKVASDDQITNRLGIFPLGMFR